MESGSGYLILTFQEEKITEKTPYDPQSFEGHITEVTCVSVHFVSDQLIRAKSLLQSFKGIAKTFILKVSLSDR